MARNIVAIAGGPSKVAGIKAVLASGFLKGLVTDELTARSLATEEKGGNPDNKDGKSRRVETIGKAKAARQGTSA